MMDIIWLSHIIDEQTPLYGGEQNIKIMSSKAIDSGDSCNTKFLSFPGHTGTHVDVPNHFFQDGKKIEDYSPDQWIFSCPEIIKVDIQHGQIISKEHLPELSSNNNVDFVIFYTGFERFRNNNSYWESGPGLAPELANLMKTFFPNIRAVGMDFISISSLLFREQGRKAHHNFLGNDIVIFEDMKLSNIKDSIVKKIIALPLLYKNSDGAPCSILAWIH
jgi:kynurenine formamidase